MPPSVSRDRLYAELDALGLIGAYHDERTTLTGVNRLALTPADGEGRRYVVQRMRDSGLAITVDRIGNVYARRAGAEDRLAPVVMGSHIDSVPTAGRFDGCLGVLGGLEVLRTLADHGVTTCRPVVVAFFTDEEGARFGTDMLGSAVATGRISLEQAYALTDSAPASPSATPSATSGSSEPRTRSSCHRTPTSNATSSRGPSCDRAGSRSAS